MDAMKLGALLGKLASNKAITLQDIQAVLKALSNCEWVLLIWHRQDGNKVSH